MNETIKPKNKLTIIFMVASFVLAIGLNFGVVSSLFLAQQSFIVRDYNLQYDFVGLLLFLTQVGWLVGAFIIYLIGRYISNIHFTTTSLLSSFLTLLFFAYMDRNLLISYGTVIFFIIGVGMTFCWVPMTDIITKYVSKTILPTVMIMITSGTCWGLLMVGYLVANSTPEQWQQLFEVGALVGGIYLALFVVFFYVFNRDVMLIKSPKTIQESAVEVGADYKKLIMVIYISNFLIGFSYISFNSYFSVYLDEELFLNSVIIGNAWTVNGLFGLLSAIILGRVVAKLGYKIAINLAYIFLLLAIFALFVADYNPVLLVYTSTVLFALGYFPIYGMLPSYMSTIFKSGITKVFAMANFLSGLGAGLGSYMGGVIKHETGSLQYMYFVIIGALIVLIILLITQLPKTSKVID